MSRAAQKACECLQEALMEARGEEQAPVPDEDTRNICLDTLGKHGGRHSLNCGEKST